MERTCPVCGAANHEPHWQKDGLRIVRCRDCGMIFVNPAPPGMASGEFYVGEGAEYYLSPAKLESDYADVRFERELRLFRKFCLQGKVLDVGCGSGAFLFQLRQRWPDAYEVLGTDVSGAPLDYAEKCGVPVARGGFPELDFDGSRFDAITFWAVIEHLADPQAFLRKAHSLLKAGGICVVLMPNLRSLATRLLGPKYRYVYAQHLNYFSAATLTRLVQDCGFEVVERRFTHFNPVVIWQDWRRHGREVSNEERGALLRQTTSLKQKTWLKPVHAAYRLVEGALATFGLADNLALVMRKTTKPSA